MRVCSAKVATAALFALGVMACSQDKKEYVQQIPACSTSYPTGACDSGQTCLEGSCVATSAICSTSNTSGSCPSGFACYAGGCLPAAAMPDACSASAPAGTCESGQACLAGTCVAAATMCSATNQAGLCPAGWSCHGGGCILDAFVPPSPPPGIDCSVAVYTAQPGLAFAAAVPTDSTGAALGTQKHEITLGALRFRDLSGDGVLQKYEDWRYPAICRAQDLVSRMTVPQKVGLMSEGGGLGNGTVDGSIPESVRTFIMTQHGRQGLVRFGTVTAQQLAVYTNRIQALAEVQPLGIPLAITGDPAHATSLSMNSSGVQSQSTPAIFTAWPGTLGLGAINNLTLTEAHGDCVRREFSAVGLRWQLGPMADLATEPRWNRVAGTFGSTAHHVGKHVAAIVRGFQGSSTGDLRQGIASTLKHFPGHGAQEGGRDPHSYYGRYTVYPGDNLAYHFIPFQYGFDEGAAAIMPCYAIYKNETEWDPLQTPAGYSHPFITELAKDTMGFTGMVTGDWQTGGQWSWNLNMMTGAEKAALWLEAGSHQFGLDPFSQFQDAYDQQLVTPAQIDEAAAKILEMSFKLGLFENPYVVEPAVTRTVDDRTLAFQAQKRAIVLLRNQDHVASTLRYLPINGVRYTDRAGGTTGAPDPGEQHCDANADGQVSVYFDGVVDSIVADPARPDGVQDILGDYDYTSLAAGTALPVVAEADITRADVAIIRIASRGGSQAIGVPLSFDKELTPEEAGFQSDTTVAVAAASKKKVIDAFRVRDGYVNAAGTAVPASNPTLKIVVVMNLARPSIVRAFIQGLVSLDETPGVPGSYPSVSSQANIRATANGGVDAFLVDFGAFDRAVLDFLFNRNAPPGVTYGEARLPMEIPSTDEEVDAQFEDLPDDTNWPTFQIGAGSALPAT